MKQILKLLVLCALSLGLLQCGSDDRFYRPRVPQKLSALAIINADDTLRYILFEKTVQIEYPEDLTDSLRDLSFTISDSKGVIHSFHSDVPLENKFNYRIPDSIEFMTGEKYFFWAKERDLPEISSETTVPETPSGLSLKSIHKEFIFDFPDYLIGLDDDSWGWTDIISLSFDNDKSNYSFNTIMVKSDGFGGFPQLNYGSTSVVRRGYPDFALRKSDAPGFLAPFPGLPRLKLDPLKKTEVEIPAEMYFIESKMISGESCNIELVVQTYNYISLPARPFTLWVQLLSIPEEMYSSVKNLYTYERNYDDPFSEPVYYKGNIVGGHGIFAVCRSIEIRFDATQFSLPQTR
ncbi:MAG: DUF4249 family protein [Bacteroidales bacterium]